MEVKLPLMTRVLSVLMKSDSKNVSLLDKRTMAKQETLYYKTQHISFTTFVYDIPCCHQSRGTFPPLPLGLAPAGNCTPGSAQIV